MMTAIVMLEYYLFLGVIYARYQWEYGIAHGLVKHTNQDIWLVLLKMLVLRWPVELAKDLLRIRASS